MNDRSAVHSEETGTDEGAFAPDGAAFRGTWTCNAWRDALETQTLVRLRERSEPLNTPIVDPATTVIALDLGDFTSPEEADAAEGAIDWFSRRDAEMKRQRACRTAFAALELQRYLRRIADSGDGFPIQTIDAHGQTGKTIFRLVAADGADDTDGRFEIAVDHEGAVFRGLSIQGCLYAVYEYLEQLGCVFLEPGGASDVLASGPVRMPRPTVQTPSFYWRRLHGWRKNRATPELIDWMGKARINVWGADNLVPSMRKRGILLASGMHDIIPVLGLNENFNVLDPKDRRQLREGIVRAFADGPYTDADICEYIGADWGPRPEVKFEGNTTDLEIRAIHEVRDALRDAFRSGRINRDIFVSGYAYFDCEEPPGQPMPEGFDAGMIAIEYWSMRCWEHLLGEPACSDDFPVVATMHHYVGKLMHMPSNRRIYERLRGWGRSKYYTGRLGMGHYFSNAGNFYTPLILAAAITYEMPLQHRLGVRQVNYMHIAASDWGPWMLTNYLYRKLAWSVDEDAPALMAKYFQARFGDAAEDVARAYCDLERAVAPLPVLKRVIVNWLKMRGSLQPVAEHGHVRAWNNDEVGLAAACDRVADVARRLEQIGGSEIQRDLRWIHYARLTLQLYHMVMDASGWRERDDTAEWVTRLRQAWELVQQLRQVNLRLHLPEKVAVDAAEASGLLEILQTMLCEAGQCVDEEVVAPAVQTDIMPVRSYPESAHQENPELRYPDPAWSAPPARNEVGLELERLWHTDIKHYGSVAQTVDGRMLVALVGEDRKTSAGELGTLEGSSVICAAGNGGMLWRHDFSRPGFKVHTGPWPAFVDLTGQGEWAVSVYVLFDGGPGHRLGYVHLYDARTGTLRWRCRTQQEYDYPGGNGACVAADIDGDGQIELVYGLTNVVLCLNALDGAVKWIYDDRIKICHGRLSLADVNGDGLPEIIVATEYSDDPDNPQCDRSSILTLDGAGRLLRRLSNIQGDLGSTQIVVTDVDGDGQPEIVHGSENLVYHQPRHMGQLFVLERWLTPKLDPVPTGGARFAVADMDGDGAPEAVGITSYRDGGPYVRPEIFCVRVRDGRVKWRTPVARVWLDGDAILVDVDGDGRLEAIVTANYPSGYMHQPGTSPWCDFHILNHKGKVLYQQTLPDAAVSPIVADLDGDGYADILVPCYDGWVYRIRTHGPARHGDWPLVCRDAQRTGAYE